MEHQANLSQTESFLAYQSAETLRLEKQRAHQETEKALQLLKDEHFNVISDQHDKHRTALENLNNDAVKLNEIIGSLHEEIKKEKKFFLVELDKRENDQLIFAEKIAVLRKENEINTENEKKKNERKILEILDKVALDNEILNSEHADECEQYGRLLITAQAEYKELVDRWHKRESLPEDLNRIIQLENEMVDKDELVIKTREEMLYFKREMLNREENFNQKFNRSPNVGVMQVIKSTELGASMNLNNGVGTMGATIEKNSTLKNPIPGGFGGRKSSKPSFFVAPNGGIASMGTLGMGSGSGSGSGIGTMSPAANSPGKIFNTMNNIPNTNLNSMGSRSKDDQSRRQSSS